MDTKSKSRFKAASVWMLVCSLTAVALMSLMDVVNHREFLNAQHYFSSQAFYRQLNLNVNLIKYIHIENRDYTKLSNDSKISDSLLTQWNNESKHQTDTAVNRIQKQVADKLNASKNVWNQDQMNELMQEEKSTVQQVVYRGDKQLEERKQQYIIYKDAEYANVEKSLRDRSSIFKYVLKDKTANLEYSNVTDQNDASLAGSHLFHIHFPQPYMNERSLQTLNQYFQKRQMEADFVIPLAVSEFSQIHADYAYYRSIGQRIWIEIGICAVSAAVAMALFVHARRRHYFTSLDVNASLRRIPVDVRFVLGAGALLVLLGLLVSNSLFRLPVTARAVCEFAVITCILAYLAFIGKNGMDLYLNRTQLREEWKGSVWSKIRLQLQRLFMNKSIATKVTLLFGGSMLFGMCFPVLLIGMSDGAGGIIFICGVYMLAFLIFAGSYAIRRLGALNRIMVAAERMAGGSFDESIEVGGSGNLSRMSHHLSVLKAGYQRSLEERMRSERLKSELITNVSHDLKTPLTSIINYIDLLKKQPEAESEQRQQYVEVLERKAQRLKVLIEDLFEASKVASGAVELDIQQVDVAALVNQALAEFSDRIAESSLTFRVDGVSSSVMAPLDGKKTWRVLENLITNVLKYSLPNTRVYVTLSETSEQVRLTIRNISAYEIDFDVSELYERFKRGDASRHTEGSGLGLAIAKSIVELQGGELTIDIDGDTFRITVVFRK